MNLKGIFTNPVARVAPVGAPRLAVVSGSQLYAGVSSQLITRPLRDLVAEKARIFRARRMNDAPLAEVAGYLTGFELIETEKDCAGFCDVWGRRIALNPEKDPAGLFKTLTHEMGHALQAELGVFEKGEGLLSEDVRDEHQAETISYYLYNALRPAEPLGPERFRSYFSAEDIDWLAAWYEGWRENDIGPGAALYPGGGN